MCHVLVIEDEPLIAQYVGGSIGMAGTNLVEIADTVAAEACAAQDHAPDLIMPYVAQPWSNQR